MEIRKRLFFGASVLTPWPEELPAGRIVPAESRHLTLAFLGATSLSALEAELPNFPKPPFRVGLAGLFDEPLFLPPSHPRVVAWHIRWLEQASLFSEWQRELTRWLAQLGYRREEREFNAHLTLARAPFTIRDWRGAFEKLPLALTGIHLYTGSGGLNYERLWSVPLLQAIEELEHTADIAYVIRAEDLQGLQLHAEVALALTYPRLLTYLEVSDPPQHLDEIVHRLNRLIARVDGEIGCPFKAVSYSGRLEEDGGTLKWEMIVDV